MKLEDLVYQRSLICCERWVNTFKKRFNEIDCRYDPVLGDERIKVPYYILDSQNPDVELRFGIASNKAISALRIKRVPGRYLARFYAHPQMEDEVSKIIGKKPEGYIEAFPTASARTVMPADFPGYYLKLHLNIRLSKFIRRLRRDSVEHSIRISDVLHREVANGRAPESFAFLPESVGLTYDDIGMLVREAKPFPLGDNRIMAPLFSLYGKDFKNPDDPTLFEQLVKLHRRKPIDYFVNEIVTPLLTNMGYFIEKGLLLEPHGQNVLVEMDKSFNIKRMVHRDFQSMYVEPRIGKRFDKHIMGKECDPEVSYSLVYDQYVGEYVFDHFAGILEGAYGYGKKWTQTAVRDAFDRIMDQSKFPRGHYRMAKGRFKDNETKVVLINERPRWR